jgi:hypothetical protein
MATFKCNNCGKERHESEKITTASPESVNKLVMIISILMTFVSSGNGGAGRFFRDRNVCKECQSQVYVFIGFILLFAGLLLYGFLSKIKLI